MILLIEGLAMCFLLLIVCVVGIAKDGPVGLVCFYEKDVQERVVELGLTTKDRIKRSTVIAAIAVTIPIIVLIPYMVYVINGAVGFRDAFIQMLIISLIDAALSNSRFSAAVSISSVSFLIEFVEPPRKNSRARLRFSL